jgi:glycosyltransferase involved in cell wall biosynthesis
MRLLMITQKLDPADPILAFTVTWVRHLAARVAHLHVLCLEAPLAASALPANVTVWSMGKDRGVGRAQQLIAFCQTVWRLAPQLDAVFSHMVPRYAYLAAPLVWPRRVPIVLWYTHRQDSRELRLATALCKLVISAVPDSFPFATPKLRAIGHGIDTAFFAPAPATQVDAPPLIVQVARLMPIKHQETLIRALASGLDAHVAIVGNVPPGQDPAYLTHLRTLAHDLGVADRVRFTGGLPADQVRDLYRRATVAVNLSPVGLFDKAALESMACGTLTVVCNPAFDALLRGQAAQLRIAAPTDVAGLSAALRHVLALPAPQRTDLALDIVGRTRTAHSLDGLMDRLVELMRS